jgi:hypothetical protein
MSGSQDFPTYNPTIPYQKPDKWTEPKTVSPYRTNPKMIEDPERKTSFR